MRGIAVKMTKPVMQALAEHHRWEADEYRRMLAKAACNNCNNWQMHRCQKFEVVPPADIQKTGCDDYEFDSIPF